MSEQLKKIKEVIALSRRKAGMSQEDMAQALGISQPAYSYHESGNRPISVKNIRKIAEILSIPLEALIGDSAQKLEPDNNLRKIVDQLERIADTLDKLVPPSSKKCGK